MPEPDYSIDVALTFDDGPDGVAPTEGELSAKPYNTTRRVLTALAKEQPAVTAAFFVQTHAPGHLAEEVGRKLVEEAHKAGHVIGLQNGSDQERPDHPSREASGQLRADLDRGVKALADLLKAAPEFVRGPFGLVNEQCRGQYEKTNPPEKGLKYVFWDVSANDLAPEFSATRIQQHLRAQVRQVADRVRKSGQKRQLVVQLHDTSPFTAAHLPAFLAAIRDGGKPYRPQSKKAPKAGVPVAVKFCGTRDEVAAILKNNSDAKHGPRPAKGKLARLRGVYGDDFQTLKAWNLIWFEDWVPHLYLDSVGLVTVGVGHLLRSAAAAGKLTGLVDPEKPAQTTPDDRERAWKSIAKLKGPVLYKLTAGVRAALKAAKVPEAVLTKLDTLKKKKTVWPPADFQAALATALTEGELKEWGKAILKHALVPHAPKPAWYYKKRSDPNLQMGNAAIRTLMEKDILDHERDLVRWLNEKRSSGTDVYATAPVPVRIALLDMAYNLGEKRLRKYVNLRAAVQAGDWAKAGQLCHRKGPPPERNAYTKELFEVAAALAPPRDTTGRALPRGGLSPLVTDGPDSVPSAAELSPPPAGRSAAADAGPAEPRQTAPRPFAIIGVVGRTWLDPKDVDAAKQPVLALAREVGARIARHGHAVLTGGHHGHAEPSVKHGALAGAAGAGTAERPARIIGILPAAISAAVRRGRGGRDVEPFSDAGGLLRCVYVHTLMPSHQRDPITAQAADVLIALWGGDGTAREVVAALRAGRPVVYLESWPGSWEDFRPRMRPKPAEPDLAARVTVVATPEKAVSGALRAIHWGEAGVEARGRLVDLPELADRYDRAVSELG